MAPVERNESERCPQKHPRRTSHGPEPLTEEAWSPFGWLPVADVDPRDGKETMTFEWADAHVNLIGHARDRGPRDRPTASAATCSSATTPTPRP